MKLNLLIWDDESAPPSDGNVIVLWSNYNSNFISIPALVEDKADIYRARYLSWIYELGETCIHGKRIIDHLEIRKDLSFWWMTLLAQRFNVSGESNINNAIKLLAFEEIANKYEIASLTLFSDENEVAEVLESFCKNNNILFQYNHKNDADRRERFQQRIFKSLPKAVQSFYVFFKHVLRIWVNKKRPVKISMNIGGICVFDVLVHLDKRAYSEGPFNSNYWTKLVDMLDRTGVTTNWFHLFFQHKGISTYTKAEELIQRFNNSNTQNHFLLESELSISVVSRALSDFIKLQRIKNRIGDVSRIFEISGASLKLWPLFEKDWNESLTGVESIINCLRLSLMESALSKIPFQKTGIYIQENQHWEMALIHAWRMNGHGKLIGIPHSTVRFWDLRYFYDPRSYLQNSPNSLPVPDLVAVNGPVAKNAYIKGGYPELQIAEVEALRYFHLHQNGNMVRRKQNTGSQMTILICGDFLQSTTSKMLRWIEEAAKTLPPATLFILKPHPAYSIDLSNFPSLNFKVSDSPLPELFPECDVVFTSNITSAAVDAFCTGIRVIQMLDGKSFNTSPLRGVGNVNYVSDRSELEAALKNMLLSGNNTETRFISEPYFFLDLDLPRWKKLLSDNP